MLKTNRDLKASRDMLKASCEDLVCAIEQNPNAFDGLEFKEQKRVYRPMKHHRHIAHISIVGVGLAWLLRMLGH